MNKVRLKVKALISDVMNIDIDKIDNNLDLTKIDAWDSFNNLMLISKVENEFKIKFTVKDIEDVHTINKVVEIVEKKLK